MLRLLPAPSSWATDSPALTRNLALRMTTRYLIIYQYHNVSDYHPLSNQIFFCNGLKLMLIDKIKIIKAMGDLKINNKTRQLLI